MLRVLLQIVQTKKQGRKCLSPKIDPLWLSVEIVQEKSFFCCVLKHFTHKFRVCKSCYSFVFSVVSILTNIGRFLHLNLAQVYVVGSGTNILQPAWQHQLKAGFIYTPRAIYSKGKKQVWGKKAIWNRRYLEYILGKCKNSFLPQVRRIF